MHRILNRRELRGKFVAEIGSVSSRYPQTVAPLWARLGLNLFLFDFFSPAFTVVNGEKTLQL